jgi:hypothetical protein
VPLLSPATHAQAQHCATILHYPRLNPLPMFRTRTELSRVMELTPPENLLLPTETITTVPSQRDLHVRPAELPTTSHRVVLLGASLVCHYCDGLLCLACLVVCEIRCIPFSFFALGI